MQFSAEFELGMRYGSAITGLFVSCAWLIVIYIREKQKK